MICARCGKEILAETDGEKQWCSWCNNWALGGARISENKTARHEELRLNPYLPDRRSADRKLGGKDWQQILTKLAITQAKPEHHSPGKLGSPYHSRETYSDVMAMVIRLSELEGQYYNTINVYPTYIEAFLHLPGSHSEKFYRVDASKWQHEIDYEWD